VRGKKTEIIEDAVPLINVPVSAAYEKKPQRVYLAPQGTELDFTYENGRVKFTVPEVVLHQMAVIE